MQSIKYLSLVSVLAVAAALSLAFPETARSQQAVPSVKADAPEVAQRQAPPRNARSRCRR